VHNVFFLARETHVGEVGPGGMPQKRRNLNFSPPKKIKTLGPWVVGRNMVHYDKTTSAHDKDWPRFAKHVGPTCKEYSPT
jgi:hypothetical protein